MNEMLKLANSLQMIIVEMQIRKAQMLAREKKQ